MIDFSVCDPRFLDGIDTVVAELVRTAELDSDTVLVVGATCRDILHSSLGHEFALRGTEDLDIGIAVTDWATYDRVATAFPRTGHTGIRHLVAGLPVDVMPFGGVEDPSGVVTPAARGERVVVFGFDDVYGRAPRLALPSGAVIRIPDPAGYTALKLRAWIDRAPLGHDKDAKDLAAALYWYRESEVIKNRLWDTAEGHQILDEVDWDIDRGAARLLGGDVREQLSDANAADLAKRWSTTNVGDLARSLELPAGVTWPRDPGRRLVLVAELAASL